MSNLRISQAWLGLYGIDEILALSIVYFYGSIGFTNYSYLDKMKARIIAILNAKDGKSSHTFLDDIICELLPQQHHVMQHKDYDKSAIINKK